MKTISVLISTLAFGYATAQIEPKTSQVKPADTTTVPVPHNKSDDSIANKGILKRNTIESGMGKPESAKRKKIKTIRQQPKIVPRTFTDSTGKPG